MDRSGRLAMKAAALGQVVAVEDAPVDGALPEGVVPLGEQRVADGTLRFVEVVFPDGVDVHVEDERGRVVQVGRRRQMPDGSWRLRLPFPGAVAPAVEERYALELTAGNPGGQPGSARQLVFEALVRAYRQGAVGLTDEAIAQVTGLSVKPVSGRRHELVQRGWVEAAPSALGTTAKGGPSKLWRLTSAAVEWLKEQ